MKTHNSRLYTLKAYADKKGISISNLYYHLKAGNIKDEVIHINGGKIIKIK